MYIGKGARDAETLLRHEKSNIQDPLIYERCKLQVYTPMNEHFLQDLFVKLCRVPFISMHCAGIRHDHSLFLLPSPSRSSTLLTMINRSVGRLEKE